MVSSFSHGATIEKKLDIPGSWESHIGWIIKSRKALGLHGQQEERMWETQCHKLTHAGMVDGNIKAMCGDVIFGIVYYWVYHIRSCLTPPTSLCLYRKITS